MATIKRYEDLAAWQKADAVETLVVRLTRKPELQYAFKLREQWYMSAGSICANIAEGFNRGGDNEFKQHLSYAKGSSAEVRSWARTAFKLAFISEAELQQVVETTRECEKVIQGLIDYLRGSPYKGSKFTPIPPTLPPTD